MALSALSAACGSTTPPAGTFPLPSDGWKAGDSSKGAAYFGQFHAEMTVNGACAWLGPQQHATLWPAGYRVRFNPTELIGPNGDIIAKAGQQLQFGGGGATERNRCAKPGEEETIALTSSPRAG